MAKEQLLLKAVSIAAIVPVALTGLAGCANEEPQAKPKKEKPKNESGEDRGGGGGGLPFNLGEGGGNERGETEEPPYGGGGGGMTPEPGPTNNGGGSGGGGGGTDTVRFGSNDLSDIDWDVNCLSGDSPLVSGGDGSYDPDAPYFIVMFEGDKVSSVSIRPKGKIGEVDSLYWSSTSREGKVEGKYDGKTVQVSGTGLLNYTDPAEFEISATCDTVI